ncbi:keratin, type I cytoskeletal 10-like [Amborella trichopoda]|uniref:keratin, type I cytoskeletal 10-like n=1 Tax=Amborella trichopoda TaxID=13333 RepID=UPI0005D300B4|nr:keratin, type I cytoskeletal 10-like [Amborella trichopoda]|eukprot:XP_011622055.1 keratin, type I cytoskeletal 10-like [Amborella trichopoda]
MAQMAITSTSLVLEVEIYSTVVVSAAPSRTAFSCVSSMIIGMLREGLQSLRELPLNELREALAKLRESTVTTAVGSAPEVLSNFNATLNKLESLRLEVLHLEEETSRLASLKELILHHHEKINACIEKEAMITGRQQDLKREAQGSFKRIIEIREEVRILREHVLRRWCWRWRGAAVGTGTSVPGGTGFSSGSGTGNEGGQGSASGAAGTVGGGGGGGGSGNGAGGGSNGGGGFGASAGAGAGGGGGVSQNPDTAPPPGIVDVPPVDVPPVDVPLVVAPSVELPPAFSFIIDIPPVTVPPLDLPPILAPVIDETLF